MATPEPQPAAAVSRLRVDGGLRRSEHRALLVAGDIVALSGGVVMSLWVWSIMAGHSFSLTFVEERVAWFLAVPVWLLVLVPAYDLRTAL